MTKLDELIEAIENKRDTGDIKVLIDSIQNINTLDEEGNTALSIAVIYGNLEIVKHLVAKGANVNLRDINSGTALIEAAYFGHLQIVQYLINNGANVNLPYITGWTPLTHAVYNGYLDVAESLLKNGAIIETRDFFFASRRGYQDIVNLLNSNQFKDQILNNKFTAIQVISQLIPLDI